MGNKDTLGHVGRGRGRILEPRGSEVRLDHEDRFLFRLGVSTEEDNSKKISGSSKVVKDPEDECKWVDAIEDAPEDSLNAEHFLSLRGGKTLGDLKGVGSEVRLDKVFDRKMAASPDQEDRLLFRLGVSTEVENIIKTSKEISGQAANDLEDVRKWVDALGDKSEDSDNDDDHFLSLRGGFSIFDMVRPVKKTTTSEPEVLTPPLTPTKAETISPARRGSVSPRESLVTPTVRKQLASVFDWMPQEQKKDKQQGKKAKEPLVVPEAPPQVAQEEVPRWFSTYMATFQENLVDRVASKVVSKMDHRLKELSSKLNHDKFGPAALQKKGKKNRQNRQKDNNLVQSVEESPIVLIPEKLKCLEDKPSPVAAAKAVGRAAGSARQHPPVKPAAAGAAIKIIEPDGQQKQQRRSSKRRNRRPRKNSSGGSSSVSEKSESDRQDGPGNKKTTDRGNKEEGPIEIEMCELKPRSATANSHKMEDDDTATAAKEDYFFTASEDDIIITIGEEEEEEGAEEKKKIEKEVKDVNGAESENTLKDKIEMARIFVAPPAAVVEMPPQVERRPRPYRIRRRQHQQTAAAAAVRRYRCWPNLDGRTDVENGLPREKARQGGGGGEVRRAVQDSGPKKMARLEDKENLVIRERRRDGFLERRRRRQRLIRRRAAAQQQRPGEMAVGSVGGGLLKPLTLSMPTYPMVVKQECPLVQVKSYPVTPVKDYPLTPVRDYPLTPVKDYPVSPVLERRKDFIERILQTSSTGGANNGGGDGSNTSGTNSDSSNTTGGNINVVADWREMLDQLKARITMESAAAAESGSSNASFSSQGKTRAEPIQSKAGAMEWKPVPPSSASEAISLQTYAYDLNKNLSLHYNARSCSTVRVEVRLEGLEPGRYRTLSLTHASNNNNSKAKIDVLNPRQEVLVKENLSLRERNLILNLKVPDAAGQFDCTWHLVDENETVVGPKLKINFQVSPKAAASDKMAKGKRNKVTKKMKAEKKRTANNKLLRSKPKTKSESSAEEEFEDLAKDRDVAADLEDAAIDLETTEKEDFEMVKIFGRLKQRSDSLESFECVE